MLTLENLDFFYFEWNFIESTERDYGTRGLAQVIEINYQMGFFHFNYN